MKIKTNSEKKTKRIAESVAEKVLDKEITTLIALKGNLGAGKTTFVKGFAKKLGIENITSPTFVIMKKYPLEKEGWNFLYHIDCYRLESQKDLTQINFKEIKKDKNSIILLEWPEKVSLDLNDWLQVKFEFISENKRKLIFSEELGLKITKV